MVQAAQDTFRIHAPDPAGGRSPAGGSRFPPTASKIPFTDRYLYQGADPSGGHRHFSLSERSEHTDYIKLHYRRARRCHRNRDKQLYSQREACPARKATYPRNTDPEGIEPCAVIIHAPATYVPDGKSSIMGGQSGRPEFLDSHVFSGLCGSRDAIKRVKASGASTSVLGRP